MYAYDLYGFIEDLETIKDRLQNILEIRFIPSYSDYLGGDYYHYGDVGEEEFTLQNNFNPFFEDWAEEEHKDVKVLLRINETTQAQSLQQKIISNIPEAKLLKREVFED